MSRPADGAQPDLLLASVLQVAAESAAAHGFYDPIRNIRSVRLDRDRTSALARMISWHETFHAYLNASTTHGVAMMFAGALANAQPRFMDMVVRLVSSCRTTHETYATVAAASAVSRDGVDAALLANYPGYQPFLAAFDATFPTAPMQPMLTMMALTSCARAAMQTSAYAPLLATPCASWPDIDWQAMASPDARFRALMTPAHAERARTDMEASLKTSGLGDAYAAAIAAGAGGERAFWRDAPGERLTEASQAAFDAYAAILRRLGHATGGFDDQQHELEALIAKVESFAGAHMSTRFVAARALGDDDIGVFRDFRSEQLVTSERQRLSLVDATTHDVSAAALFRHGAAPDQYAELVMMPVAKCTALYAPIEQEELLATCSDGVAVALRRRWAPPGLDATVEMFLLNPFDKDAVLAELKGAPIDVVCALSALGHDSWARRWLLGDDGPAPRIAVSIDTDPFELVSHHLKRGARLNISFLSARLHDDLEAHTEILCVAASDEPDVIYFMPCSTPMRQAMTEFADRAGGCVDFDASFITAWLPMIGRVGVHALREEGRFGDRFWLA